MDTYRDKSASQHVERRRRADLREIFEDVVALITPFFREGGSASPDFWAAHAVRESYPGLDTQGFQILMAAANCVARARASSSGGNGAC